MLKMFGFAGLHDTAIKTKEDIKKVLDSSKDMFSEKNMKYYAAVFDKKRMKTSVPKVTWGALNKTINSFLYDMYGVQIVRLSNNRKNGENNKFKLVFTDMFHIVDGRYSPILPETPQHAE